MIRSPVTVPHTEDHVIHSDHVGADFHLWIGKPMPGWRGPSRQATRVLYLLDADLYFGTAVEMTRLMHQLYGELPPILVAGVAYGVEDPRLQAELRSRDFTPTRDTRFQEVGERMSTERAPSLPEGERMGRAAEFLAFLRDEAGPYVEKHFGVDRVNSVIFGSSLGGLFTLWAFLRAPDSFGSFVATSPAVWWDHEMLFDLEAELARTRDDVAARLVLAVGALEETDRIPALAQFKMVTNVRRMADRLASRRYASLGLVSWVLDGETHTSVAPAALTRALRWLTQPGGGGESNRRAGVV